MALNLEKIESLSLRKTAEVAKRAVDASALNGQRAKFVLALDFSISMERDYKTGAMQRFAERMLALSTQLDDDGSIDVVLFDTSAKHVGEISVTDFPGAVDRLTKNRRMGGTNYADAFLKIRSHFGFAPPAAAKKGFFGKLMNKVQPAQTGPAEFPVYVAFLTDGEPQNQDEAALALTEVSTAPMFFKFLSIGPRKIPFLQQLDDLDARFLDNADYQHIADPDTIDSADLFDKMLEEFPDWVTEARANGLIR